MENKKVSLNEYLQENSSLLSTFAIFITGAISAPSFMPGIPGIILAVAFSFLSIYLLQEIMDTYESADFTDPAHRYALVLLAIILGSLYLHIGLHAKKYLDFVFYLTVFLSVFIVLFMIGIVLGG